MNYMTKSSSASVCTDGLVRLQNHLLKSGTVHRRMSAIPTIEAAANFEDIVRTRTFTRSFDKDRSIDPVLIERLLRLSQMAPSSFNLQPYKMILVQDEAARAALADTMLGGNGQRVLDAPLTIVYLSDKGTDSFFFILDYQSAPRLFKSYRIFGFYLQSQ